MRVAESSPKSMWLKRLATLRTAAYTADRTRVGRSKPAIACETTKSPENAGFKSAAGSEQVQMRRPPCGINELPLLLAHS